MTHHKLPEQSDWAVVSSTSEHFTKPTTHQQLICQFSPWDKFYNWALFHYFGRHHIMNTEIHNCINDFNEGIIWWFCCLLINATCIHASDHKSILDILRDCFIFYLCFNDVQLLYSASLLQRIIEIIYLQHIRVAASRSQHSHYWSVSRNPNSPGFRFMAPVSMFSLCRPLPSPAQPSPAQPSSAPFTNILHFSIAVSHGALWDCSRTFCWVVAPSWEVTEVRLESATHMKLQFV